MINLIEIFWTMCLKEKGLVQDEGMRGCLSSTTFAILVNGNAKRWVKAYKGLRQGDPLSLFLFILVVDVLSMIVRAEERGLFEGFLVGRNRIEVSHFTICR